MAITYFVKAAVSEYEDKTDGKIKKRYQTIGVIMETKHGLMLKLETLPLFALKDGGLLAYLNPPEDKAIPTEQVAPEVAKMADDIPF
jgi:hypothetical protein